MTVESRENLYPIAYTTRSYSAPSTTAIYTIAKGQGTTQMIDSVRTGKFVPGRFRVNPVSINKTTTKTDSVDLHTVRLKSPWAYAWYEVGGEIPAFLLRQRSGSIPTDSFGNLFDWSDALANVSITKAHSQANEADLDVGVMLGELPETLEFLRDIFMLYRPVLNSISRAARGLPAKKVEVTLGVATAAASSAWLTYRYGIYPMIQQVNDILEHVHSQLSGVNLNLQRVKRGHTIETTRTGDLLAVPQYLRFNGRYVETVKRRATTHLYFTYAGTVPLLRRYGLDIGNSPSVFWELVPLSFVWDWFIGIGDWLKSMNTDLQRTMVGSCTTMKASHKISVTYTSVNVENSDKVVPPIVVDTWGKRAPGASYEKEQLIRKINLAKPLSPSVLRLPLNLVRSIDAVSLIWQRMPKLKR